MSTKDSVKVKREATKKVTPTVEEIDYSEFFEDEPAQETGRRYKERPKFTLVHEDERIVVFNKSSGISSIRERWVEGVSLKEIAEETMGQLWIVHRIDKETSGLIVFARDAEAHKLLNHQFEHGEVTKHYAAILEGEMADPEMTIDIPISSDPVHPGRSRPNARGKASITLLHRRELFRGYTFVDAEPKTGRQHQIRVHCRAVGLPLAVDSFYGNRSELLLSSLKRKYRSYDREEKPLIARLTLHAESLSFIHPGSKETVTFHAELPKDMLATLTQLRKSTKK